MPQPIRIVVLMSILALAGLGWPGALSADDRTADTPPLPPGDAVQEKPPVAAPGRANPMPLSPPGRPADRAKEDASPPAKPGIPSVVTVGASLAVVLGLFLVAAWVMRRTAPGNCPLLPGEVLEVLGRAPLSGRQQVQLIRLGNKLVLLSVAPTGVETLSEVTDPEEVDRLAALCQRVRPGSATAVFRQVFQQFTKEHRFAAGDRGGAYAHGLAASSATGGRSEGSDV